MYRGGYGGWWLKLYKNEYKSTRDVTEFLAEKFLKESNVGIRGILRKLSSMILLELRGPFPPGSSYGLPLHLVCASRTALITYFHIEMFFLCFSPSPQVRDFALVFVSSHNAWHLINVCWTWRNMWAMNLESWVADRFWILLNGRPKNSDWLFPIGNGKPLICVFKEEV